MNFVSIIYLLAEEQIKGIPYMKFYVTVQRAVLLVPFCRIHLTYHDALVLHGAYDLLNFKNKVS